MGDEMDHGRTPKRKWDSSDPDETEAELTQAAKKRAYRENLSDEKKEENKRRARERMREYRARQKAILSATASRETSVERTPSKVPILARNTDDSIFVTPTTTIRRPRTIKDESESDVPSETSHVTPIRTPGGSQLTPDERKRIAAEKKRLSRQQETPEQKKERQRRDNERKKAKRALEKAARGQFSTEDDITVSSACTSRDPSEERFFIPDDGSMDTMEVPETSRRPRTEAERKEEARRRESTPVREARLEDQRIRSAARIANETPEQERARLDDQQRRSAARIVNETPEQTRARLDDQYNRSAARIVNETPEQRRSRLDDQSMRTENQRAEETDEQYRARIDADIIRRKQRERDIEKAARRRELDAARQKRVREKMRNPESSDSEDGEDHIQSPRTVDPLDIGERKPCPKCGAKIYGNSQFCCNNGTVAIPPEEKYEDEMEQLMYGTGPLAKEFKKKILNYGSAFGLASLQRKNEPVAKHGLPVAKIQGAVDAYPSTAFPYGQNQEAFGNIFVYEGKEAMEMRMKYGHDLNKEVVEILQKAMEKNKLGKQYKNMKEVMNELNPNDKPSAVRLKIINAWNVDTSKLQGHKGIYRTENQDSKDFIAVFYRASVEQSDIDLPGLIVYPYRNTNAILPVNYWDPLVEPLCYTLLRPYGEYGFVPKRFPKKSEKVKYWTWLANWLKANPHQAEKSELKLTPKEVFEKAQMLEDVPAEYVIDDGTVDMDHENIRDYGDTISQEETEADEAEITTTEAENLERLQTLELLRSKTKTGVQDARSFDAERIFEEGEEAEETPPEAEEAELQPDYDIDRLIEDAEIPEGIDENNSQDEDAAPFDSEPSSDDSDEDGDERNKKSQKRKWVSHREYLVWQYQEREHQENRYINSGKLGQVFLMHGLTRILRGRARKYREFNTMRIKTTKMKYLRAMERKMEKKGYKLGVATLMPRSVAGSPRWLQSKFENAVALANRLGKIDLFITATCNTNWPEIKKHLKPGQTWADNPFLVNNVFNEKWKKLKDLLLGKKNAVGKRPGGIFGKHRWYSGSIEFQSRGPPHIHLVVSLKHHIKTTTQIDKVCQATFPSASNDPILRKLVEDFMVHSPCDSKPDAYCREGLKNKQRPQCTKNFPKEFNATTKFGDKTYPELKRPNDKITSSKNKHADNRWIVPYNGTLLSAWRGHLNIEVVSTVKVVKYIFKYIFKGFDRVLVQSIANTDGLDSSGMTIDGHLIYPKGLRIPPGEIERRKKAAVKILTEQGIDLTDKNGNPTLVYDETVIIQDMRVLTSCEAAWELAKYPRHMCSHTVIYEAVHEEDQEPLFYKEEDEEKVKEKIEKTGFPTKLKAWFKLNQEDEDARDLTFQEIPYFYTFRNGKWIRKKRVDRHLIARIQSVPPKRREAFAIRLLCQLRRGITSFKDLRTVEGVTYDTYTEAAKALGIMNDQKEWNDCMAEAAASVSPCQLRRLFMQILTNNIVLDPLTIYRTHREDFWENKNWSDATKEAHALYHMRSYLSAQGKTLADFNLPDVIETDLPAEDDLEDDSGRRRVEVSPRFAARLRDGLKDEQREIYDKIFNAIDKGIPYTRGPDDKNVFFLQGSGGVGKTVVMKALYYNLLAEGKKVACVAHTGIAASLLPGGQTAHRLFHLPLLLENPMNCQVELETADADYLKQFHCIIWDEATMTDTRVYEAVHRLMAKLHQVNDTVPFGGTFLVLAGDWKQTLPIDPEAKSVGIVDRTLLHWQHKNWIKYFQLTKNRRAEDPAYAEYLEEVGLALINAKRGTGRPEDELVKLPAQSIVNSEKQVIKKVFGEKGSPAEKFDSFKDAAILTVDNKTTFDINNIALTELLDTPEHEFLSVDTHDETTGLAALDPESYHPSTPPGMPPHALKLKVGAVVILLRNINVALGLTNGTRLIVTKIGDKVLHLKHVHPRRNLYGRVDPQEDIILGKMLFASNKPASRELSFTRKQFPLRLAFSITVNRAQGQTLERAGLILRTPCFSHGQLYVALSRVRTPSKLFIHNYADNPHWSNNVVFPQVINALESFLPGSTKRGIPSSSVEEVVGSIDSNAMDTSCPPSVFADNKNPLDEEDELSHIDRMEAEFLEELDKAWDEYMKNDDDYIQAQIEEQQMNPDLEMLEEEAAEKELGIREVQVEKELSEMEIWKALAQGFRELRTSVRPTDDEGILLLDNELFYCFANVAVQVLHHLYKKEIMKPRESNAVMKELKEIAKTKHHTKDLLRLAPGLSSDQFDNPQEQHDAEEYLRYLVLWELPYSFHESMEFTILSQITCCSCLTMTEQGGQTDTQAHVSTVEKGHPFNFYLRSCETLKVDKVCTCSSNRSIDHIINYKLCIPESLRYFFLSISQLKKAHDPKSKIVRKMQAPLDIEIAFEHRWKPTAMIEYKVLSNLIRHYAVYLKKDKGWIRISDSQKTELDGPPDMTNISMVILEKLDKVREKRPSPIRQLIPKVVNTIRDKVFSDTPKEKPSSDICIPDPPAQTNQPIRKKISLFHGNLLDKSIPADVVVNAANPKLQKGGGVCGDIFKKAGVRDLEEECEEAAETLQGGVLHPGQAVATDACRMKPRVKWIVHTAAPNLNANGRTRRPDTAAEENLRMCYINSCLRADEKGGKSVVFPVLGIGIYGYDQRQGIAVAIQSFYAYFEAYPQTGIESITLAILGDRTYKQARSLMSRATSVEFQPREAKVLRKNFEHFYEELPRPQDIRIPGTSVDVCSFVNSLKARK